jgi:hypothetical protein
VLRMPAARFSELLMRRPDVVEHIQLTKRRTMVKTYSFVAGLH